MEQNVVFYWFFSSLHLNTLDDIKDGGHRMVNVTFDSGMTWLAAQSYAHTLQ